MFILNKKGVGVFGLIGMFFLLALVAPIILMQLLSISKILFQVILAFVILGYVKNMGIEGPLMWILSGILIYFMVYKYVYLTTSLYTLMMMMTFGVTSMIFWGSSFLRTKMAAKKH
jgi:hypothetical protein